MKRVMMVFVFLLFLGGPGVAFAEDDQSGPVVSDEEGEAPAYCPVCGPEEDDELPFLYKYNGKRYRFCSLECMRAFRSDPAAYAGTEDGASSAAGHEGYTHHDHKDHK
jgi:YHS domain-containing protein